MLPALGLRTDQAHDARIFGLHCFRFRIERQVMIIGKDGGNGVSAVGLAMALGSPALAPTTIVSAYLARAVTVTWLPVAGIAGRGEMVFHSARPWQEQTVTAIVIRMIMTHTR